MDKKNGVIDSRVVGVVAIHVVAFLAAVRVVNPMVKSSMNMHYYLQKDYTSLTALFKALGKGDLFRWCCDCILYFARMLGLSYEQLNIDVFVILQPLLISCLLILFVLQSWKLKVG